MTLTRRWMLFTPSMSAWVALVWLFIAPVAFAQTLDSDVLDQVRNNMNFSSTTSWEMGTASEAILENDLSLSVYKSAPPFTFTRDLTENELSPVLYFARNALNRRNGSKAIMDDASAGDPASLGTAVLLGNLSHADTGIPNVTFASAASDEVEFLLTAVPRAPNGAISHRVDEVQLWADFVYMCPPFLAYYGVVTNNQSLVQEAYTQVSLYRDVLKHPSGLWQHVALGSQEVDSGNWSTGNAWAAAGIVRVLATIQHSRFSDDMKTQQQDLTDWANEIIKAFYSYQDSTSLNHNYVDDTSTFLEASGSVLMASAVYRLALLSKVYTNVPNAERLRKTIFSSMAGTNSSSSHIDDQGWLLPVANPLSFGTLGSRSPEAQSFVLLLNAAYQDWAQGGRKGAAEGRRFGGVRAGMWLIVSGVVGIWVVLGHSL